MADKTHAAQQVLAGCGTLKSERGQRWESAWKALNFAYPPAERHYTPSTMMVSTSPAPLRRNAA
ncbi:MAG: hypothetical protein WB803_23510, partial [Pseudolabrys sp.]